MNDQHAASALFWKLELGNKKNWNVSLFGLCCNLDQFSFDFPSYLLNRNQFEVFRKKNQSQNEHCWTRFSEIPTRFGAGNLHGILPSHSVHFFLTIPIFDRGGVICPLHLCSHLGRLLSSWPQFCRLASAAVLLRLLETSFWLSV